MAVRPPVARAGLVLVQPALGRLRRLGSAATAGEGSQNLLWPYLAAAVLAGLAANALLGW